MGDIKMAYFGIFMGTQGGHSGPIFWHLILPPICYIMVGYRGDSIMADRFLHLNVCQTAVSLVIGEGDPEHLGARMEVLVAFFLSIGAQIDSARNAEDGVECPTVEFVGGPEMDPIQFELRIDDDPLEYWAWQS
jgi:hypothetical protein